MVAATLLPRWILGHYIIGAGARTMWWGTHASLTLKVMSCKTMSKKNVKKCEKPRFYGQNKLFFENPAVQPLGNFSHMSARRSSLENT
jgi:hypothetical protein